MDGVTVRVVPGPDLGPGGISGRAADDLRPGELVGLFREEGEAAMFECSRFFRRPRTAGGMVEVGRRDGHGGVLDVSRGGRLAVFCVPRGSVGRQPEAGRIIGDLRYSVPRAIFLRKKRNSRWGREMALWGRRARLAANRSRTPSHPWRIFLPVGRGGGAMTIHFRRLAGARCLGRRRCRAWSPSLGRAPSRAP